MELIFKNVTVLIADGMTDSGGFQYNIDEVNLLSTVPVTYNFNSDMVVGKARLNKVGNEIRADITINSDMVVDLLDLKQVLIPCVGGIVGDGTRKQNIIENGSISLNIIGLSPANMDKRIKPLSKGKLYENG